MTKKIKIDGINWKTFKDVPEVGKVLLIKDPRKELYDDIYTFYSGIMDPGGPSLLVEVYEGTKYLRSLDICLEQKLRWEYIHNLNSKYLSK